MPSFARDSLGVGPEGLGALTASMGGGALAGSLLLARLPEIGRKALGLRGAAMAGGLLVLLLGWAPSVLLAAPVLTLIGASSSVITALGLQMVQRYVPEELSGRVFGVYMLTMALMPLGSLPAGALADQVGTATAISLWGALGSLVIGGVLAARLLSERRVAPETAAPGVGA
jgi:MFS family permease